MFITTYTQPGHAPVGHVHLTHTEMVQQINAEIDTYLDENSPSHPDAISPIMVSANELRHDFMDIPYDEPLITVIGDLSIAVEYRTSAEIHVVTIKLPPRPDHNPRSKQTGPCAVSRNCTDTTGEHHTVVAYSPQHLAAIRHHFSHITRIERFILGKFSLETTER